MKKLTGTQLAVLAVGVLLLVYLWRARGSRTPTRATVDPDTLEDEAFADEVASYENAEDELMPVFPVGGFYETNTQPGGGTKVKHQPNKPHHKRTTLSVVTANLAWQLGRLQDKADLQLLGERGDILLLQELNHTRLRDYLDADDWRVRQARPGSDKAMTSVVSRADIPARGHDYAPGWRQRAGVKLNSRFIAGEVVELEGKPVRFASVHLPPPRFPGAWAVYAARIIAYAKSRPRVPLVIGGDFNAHAHDPKMKALARALNSNIVDTTGHGIDLFLVPKQLRVVSHGAVTNRGTRSDHPFGRIELGWRH